MRLKHQIKLALFTIIFPFVIQAAAFHTLNTRYLMTFEKVTMPNSNKDMGLLGAHLLMHENKWLYGGVGAFGAVTGNRGGFIVFGLEGGLTHELFRHVIARAGLFVGGGGGRNNNDDEGGGLMLRPSLDLLYDLHGYQLGLGYSYVTFPKGTIHSNDFTVSFSIPSHFHYLDSNTPEQGDSVDLSQQALESNPYYFSIRNQSYFQNTRTMQLLGVEFGAFIRSHWFGYGQAAAAYSGVSNGYMELVGGAGYSFLPAHSRYQVQAKLGAGVAGGGGAETGGGFIVKPELLGIYQINRGFSLGLDAGYLWSPDGRFDGATVTAQLTHNFNLLTPAQPDHAQPPTNATVQNWAFMLSNVTYLKSQRSTRSANQNRAVNLIAGDIHYFIARSFYALGEWASAYDGHAGSYATGFFGAGYQSPVFLNCMHAHAAIMLGTAGGGGIDVHHGLVWQPRVGLDVDIVPDIAAVFDVGHIQAFEGRLNTTVVTVGMKFSFATLDGTN